MYTGQLPVVLLVLLLALPYYVYYVREARKENNFGLLKSLIYAALRLIPRFAYVLFLTWLMRQRGLL